jgi:uncharacterized protein YdeI (YjbR/CyaY-like superfamily)
MTDRKTAPKPPDDLPVLSFASQEDWAAWLDANHATVNGLWLRLAKKASGLRSVTYSEAVEVALCYGWIDGQARGYDEQTSLQRFTPRRAKSVWSRINRDKAEALIAEGRMQPAGLAAVEAAKRDGRWDAAYHSPRNAVVPDDLQRALDDNPAASAFFATLSGQNRYAVLYRIQTARKAETRTKRIQQYVEMLARQETIYP